MIYELRPAEMNLLKGNAIDKLLLNLVRRKISLTNDRLLTCYLLPLLLVGKKVTLVLAFFFLNIDFKLESITFYYLRFVMELL